MIFKHFGVTLAMMVILASSNNPASAEPVTLIAHDRSAEVTGELVSFADGVYTLLTLLGPVQLIVSRVTCVGDACPSHVEIVEATSQP